MAIAGKTSPTKGTKIDGKYAALILIFYEMYFTIYMNRF